MKTAYFTPRLTNHYHDTINTKTIFYYHNDESSKPARNPLREDFDKPTNRVDFKASGAQHSLPDHS